MNRIVHGDHAALGVLYDHYAGFVLSLARRVVHDPTSAEDLVEDVFVELWRRADRYDATRGDLTTYIATLTRSRAIDRLRSARRSYAVQMSDDHDPSAIASEPAAGLLADERAVIVTHALNQLSSHQRTVIELAYYEGLSHSDIAHRLNRPLGTVKTWIRQGLLSLRDQLRTLSLTDDAGQERCRCNHPKACSAEGVVLRAMTQAVGHPPFESIHSSVEEAST